MQRLLYIFFFYNVFYWFQRLEIQSTIQIGKMYIECTSARKKLITITIALKIKENYNVYMHANFHEKTST